ncbi:MAG: insulinase family protein [Flavobacteriales bacterium]|nr:insulinase family protein [Flavobacteriales bacterium]MCB9448480.1 insulinase family protein [Flavobacteriales bacterium]
MAKNDIEIYQHQLSNGIRIAHMPMDRGVSHCGLMILAGSRDEQSGEEGLAHFIEHVIFKGTKKRKAFHILNRMESVGGELNAYTTKEETFYYSSFISTYYERAIELLADITFHSTYPEKEMVKEKEVVIDEINSYKDTPSDHIFDDFEERLFAGHALGRSILGTIDSVKSFRPSDIRTFIKRQYLTDQMVLCSVGNIPFDRLVKYAEKHLGHIPKRSGEMKRPHFRKTKHFYAETEREGFHSHCLIGNTCYGSASSKRFAMVLLNNILGGPGMNSRLNMTIREKYGYTYNIDSSYSTYADTGLFAVYVTADRKHLEKSIRLIHSEMKKLADRPLGTLQLKQAKAQLAGQVAMARESSSNMLGGLGKSILMNEAFPSMEEVVSKIEGVSAKQIQDVANEVFDPKKLSTLIYTAKS